MSYQSINNNPFQQSQSSNPDESENDEEAAHNIKFTIPPNSSEKSMKFGHSIKFQGYLFLASLSAFTAQWNHIVDLDSFFRRIYKYHQKGGFKVITLQELLELLQIVLLVVFIITAVHCVNYPVLFRWVFLSICAEYSFGYRWFLCCFENGEVKTIHIVSTQRFQTM